MTEEIVSFCNLKITENEQYEVTHISNHRVVNNSLEFYVHFKGYTEGYWISDSDCNCESIIKEYFKSKNIDIVTVYCVCRVSTKIQANPIHVSLEAQEQRLRQTAVESFGRNIRIKVIKISASAYTQINRELLNIGEAATEGDSILVYRVDRLSRNIVKILSFLEELNERDIGIFSQDENIWYKRNKLEFIQRIVDANKESEILGKRIRLSLDYRIKRGDEVFGKVAYGYTTKREENRRIVRIPEKSERVIIDRIKGMKQSGMSCSQIADFLNKNNITKRGKKWSAAMVNYTIKF